MNHLANSSFIESIAQLLSLHAPNSMCEIHYIYLIAFTSKEEETKPSSSFFSPFKSVWRKTVKLTTSSSNHSYVERHNQYHVISSIFVLLEGVPCLQWRPYRAIQQRMSRNPYAYNPCFKWSQYWPSPSFATSWEQVLVSGGHNKRYKTVPFRLHD